MESWNEVCYLCGQSASVDDHISLYPLPRARGIREKWMRILELRPSDRLSLVRVCSRHFHRADFRRQRAVAGDAPLRLLPYALPRRRIHPPHRQAGTIMHVLDHLRQLTSHLEDAMSSSSDVSNNEATALDSVTTEISLESYQSMAVTERASTFFPVPPLFAFQIDDVSAYIPPVPFPSRSRPAAQDMHLGTLLEAPQRPDQSFCFIDLTTPENNQ